MNTKNSVAFIVILLSFLTACGSKPDEVRKAASPGNSNVTANTASPSAAGQTPIPGIEGPNVAANADINAPAAGEIMTPKRRELVDVPGPVLPPAPIPAPEDSTVTSMMDKSGIAYETRVFGSDQQIAKVQKVFNATNTTAKIYLKSGKVVTVAADKIPALFTISLAEIKKLAGITPPPPVPSSDSGLKSDPNSKKKQQP